MCSAAEAKNNRACKCLFSREQLETEPEVLAQVACFQREFLLFREVSPNQPARVGGGLTTHTKWGMCVALIRVFPPDCDQVCLCVLGSLLCADASTFSRQYLVITVHCRLTLNLTWSGWTSCLRRRFSPDSFSPYISRLYHSQLCNWEASCLRWATGLRVFAIFTVISLRVAKEHRADKGRGSSVSAQLWERRGHRNSSGKT